MELVKVGYAKTHFSTLLGRVEQGEVLAIARRDKVVAQLVPASSDTRPACQAFERAWALGGFDLPDDLDALLNEAPMPPLDDVQLD